MSRFTLFCVALALFASNVVAATVTELIPGSAPRGARVVIVGQALDAPDLGVRFNAATAPARVIARSANLLEVVVPADAQSGPVTVTLGSTTLGSFPFTLSADPQYVRVTTLAASTKSHDILKEPAGTAISLTSGVVYVADQKHDMVKSIAPDGSVAVVAGGFKDPKAVALDATRGFLYVSDSGNHRVMRVALSTGTITLLAGSGKPGASDGSGATASLKQPAGIAVDGNGNVLVADSGNHAIRRITPQGVVTTLAGGNPGLQDGPAITALFKSPEGIAVTPDGIILVADTQNSAIRMIANGIVSTINIAGLKQPSTLSLDDAGNILIADTSNHVIRIDAVTLAGTGKPGYVDGAPLAAQFHQPAGITFAGALWIGDAKNDAIRLILPALAATAVYPRTAEPEGGTIVRLFGSGFIPGMTSVRFGETNAAVTYIASTELLVTVPAGTSGPVEITVTTPAGSVTLSDAFTYAPSLDSIAIDPSSLSLLIGQTRALTLRGLYSDGSQQDLTAEAVWASSSNAVATVDAAGIVRAVATGAATITATIDTHTATAMVTVAPNDPVPPDPVTVAPPLDPTGGTSTGESIAFLYSGPNAIQQGVAPGTIEEHRAGVLRGRVLDAQSRPLPAVRITIAGHPQYGSTLSRADGRFDMAVNGGATYTVRYEKNGFLPVDRQAAVPWEDFVSVPDSVLLALDSNVTPITTNSTAVQVARGSVMTDTSGSRRATMLFMPGTGATMIMPDGTLQTISSMSVRATEYTVGPEGPKRMPAPLPPQSAYTYCVELSTDEALAAGAKTVRFSQPVLFYLENFAGFATGMRVPSGWYDRAKRAWVPSPDGRVIRIVTIQDGAARVDTNGDGFFDDSGLTLAERQQLGTLYAAGTSLWRVPLSHFTPYDMNWASIAAAPLDAKPPSERSVSFATRDNACEVPGSIIECENQTLGEEIGLPGTPFAVHYRSDRTAGRVASRTLDIRLSGSTVPASLKGIALHISIAGRFIEQSFPAAPNQTHRFVWDGRDAYGRPVNGTRPVTVRIHYSYDALYEAPSGSQASFATASGISTGVPARETVQLTQTWTGTLGAWTAGGQMLGGWTLTPHHFYDVAGKTLYRGDGTRQSNVPAQFGDSASFRALTKIAGTSRADRREFIYWWTGLGGPATSVIFPTADIEGMTVGPDGSIYIAVQNYIRRITPDGRLVHFAGNGTGAISNVTAPAATSAVHPAGMAFGPDGSLYFAEPGSPLVRRIDPDGMIRTIGSYGALNFVRDVAVAEDGTVYLCDSDVHRIHRIGTDGILTTFAGTTRGHSGHGGPATNAQLFHPLGIALGKDGSLYIADRTSIRRVGPDGIIRTIAGGPVKGFSGDGGPASAALVNLDAEPRGASLITVLADGSVVFCDIRNSRIRRIDPSGIITTIAGTGTRSSVFQAPTVYGDLARGTILANPTLVAAAPDGTLPIVADFSERTIGRIEAVLPPRSMDDETFVADGPVVYVFNRQGRHLRTLDADLGTELLTFGYNGSGLLVSVTDDDGNVTLIEREALGPATAIVAPGGQRTELEASPWLTKITTAPDESTTFVYRSDGLLATMTDPRRNTTEFSWTDLGLLRTDRDPEGGQQTLTRTETSGGHLMSLSTVGGRTRRYETTDLPDGDSMRQVTSAAGLTTTSLMTRGGTTTVTNPDGSTISTSERGDPAWSMQAPFTSSATVTLPSTKSLTTTVEREATFSSPGDPLTLLTRTERTTVKGLTAVRVFDRAALTETYTSPEQRVITRQFDGAGRTTRLVLPGLTPIDYGYDERGRLQSVAQGNRQQTFTYNDRNELTSVRDALNRTVSFRYDEAGRVRTQILPDLREIQFEYDPNGNLTSITPPGRPAHIFDYTKVNLSDRYIPPPVSNTGLTRYFYNVDRELISIRRPDQTTIDLGYDQGGRLSTLTHERGALRYGYLATGKLGTITGADANLTFTYDGPLTTGTSWTGAVQASIDWTYDEFLRVGSESVNGDAVSFGYDDDGQLVIAGASTSRRNEFGAIDQTTVATILTASTFDGFGQVTDHGAWSSGGTELLTFTYTHDDVGRITGITERNGGVESYVGYSYDNAGRLEDVFYPAENHHYVYDANGNRVAKTVTRAAGSVTETAAYDDQDRLTNYEGVIHTYTANGELFTKSVLGAAASYDYDALGNLRKVVRADSRVIEYVIDAQNRRVGKKIDGTLVQGWLYSGQLRIVAELDGTGAIVSRFVYGSRANIPDYMVRRGVTYRILSDHLGSPRLVVDSTSGMIMQAISYDEFGNVISDSNPGFQPFGFAGGLYDRDTGLVRFGVRDYDPHTGRWTAKDPIGFVGGDTNLYGYTFADPVNFIDPTGQSINEILVACRIVLGLVAGGVSIHDGVTGQKTPIFSDPVVEALDAVNTGVTAGLLAKYGVGVGAKVVLPVALSFTSGWLIGSLIDQQWEAYLGKDLGVWAYDKYSKKTDLLSPIRRTPIKREKRCGSCE